MSKASKGKSKEKGKGEKGISKVVRLAEQLQKDYASFRTEWADKFNDHIKKFGQFASAVGQQIAGMSANQQIQSNVLERLDINIQAVDRGLREVFGRFEQVDVFLHKSGLPVHDLTQEELDSIKKQAEETYKDTMQECFRQVHEARAAAIKEQREKAKAAAEEAKKAAEEKAAAEESGAAEQELQSAEEQTMPAEPGGQGSDIPEGAEVFGG